MGWRCFGNFINLLCFYTINVFLCSRCCATPIQTLLLILKLLGCLARTSVSTTGEYVKLWNRAGLLISHKMVVGEQNRKDGRVACLHDIVYLGRKLICFVICVLCDMLAWFIKMNCFSLFQFVSLVWFLHLSHLSFPLSFNSDLLIETNAIITHLQLGCLPIR